MTGIMTMLAAGGGQRPLSAVMNPNTIFGSGTDPVVFAGPGNLVVTGGSGNFSYLCTFVNGDSGINIGSATTNAATFSATVTPGGSKTGNFNYRVTDNSTGQVVNVSFAVELDRF